MKYDHTQRPSYINSRRRGAAANEKLSERDAALLDAIRICQRAGVDATTISALSCFKCRDKIRDLLSPSGLAAFDAWAKADVSALAALTYPPSPGAGKGEQA